MTISENKRLSVVASNVLEALEICVKVRQSFARRCQCHIGEIALIVMTIKSSLSIPQHFMFLPKFYISDPTLLRQNCCYVCTLPFLGVWPMNSGVPCIQRTFYTRNFFHNFPFIHMFFIWNLEENLLWSYYKTIF